MLCHTMKGHTKPVYSLAYHPDSCTLVSASGDKTLAFWDPLNGRFLEQFKAHDDCIRGVAWSSNGELLSSTGDDMELRIWRRRQPSDPCE